MPLCIGPTCCVCACVCAKVWHKKGFKFYTFMERPAGDMAMAAYGRGRVICPDVDIGLTLP